MKTWLIGLWLVGGLLAGGHEAMAQQPSSLLGKSAADFSLERVKGDPVSLYDLIKGKKAILFFYATWCPHCREQLQQIDALDGELKQEGIEVVLINVGEPKSKVQKFLDGRGIALDSFMDTDSFVAQMYDVAGIPTLVFVGADGLVRYVEYGLPEEYKKILQ